MPAAPKSTIQEACMKYAVFAFALLFAPAAQTRAAEAAKPGFNPKKDLLSLHYDHAPESIP